MTRTRRPDAARRGRDRRARTVLPAPGTPRVAVGRPVTAAVVGGGIAGLAAATGLAEKGVRVTLYERGPALGGRLSGRPTVLSDGSTVTMSRGFHAFFRQYYNLRGLLRAPIRGSPVCVACPTTRSATAAACTTASGTSRAPRRGAPSVSWP